MAETYYLWTNLSLPDPDDPGNPRLTKNMKPGDTITASDLGVDDEEFKAYLESGAIRTQPYPDMPEGYTGSVTDWYREQALAVSRGELSVGDLPKALQPVKEAPVEGEAEELAKTQQAGTSPSGSTVLPVTGDKK